jgi:hypothetical protein
MNWPEVRTSRNGQWLVCVSVACGVGFAHITYDRSGSSEGLAPCLDRDGSQTVRRRPIR